MERVLKAISSVDGGVLPLLRAYGAVNGALRGQAGPLGVGSTVFFYVVVVICLRYLVFGFWILKIFFGLASVFGNLRNRSLYVDLTDELSLHLPQIAATSEDEPNVEYSHGLPVFSNL